MQVSELLYVIYVSIPFHPGAHRISIVSGVVWLSDTSFASCGHDCCIRVWELSA